MLFFLCLYLDVSAVTMATPPSLIMAPHYSHDAKTEGLTSSRGAHQVRDGRELSQHKPVLLRGARGPAKPGDSEAAWQPAAPSGTRDGAAPCWVLRVDTRLLPGDICASPPLPGHQLDSAALLARPEGCVASGQAQGLSWGCNSPGCFQNLHEWSGAGHWEALRPPPVS